MNLESAPLFFCRRFISRNLGGERKAEMSKIFDNIGEKFEDGLKAILSNIGVKRADFCAGYFNLRGWRQVASEIQNLPGCAVVEKDAKGVPTSVHRVCRLLIGMYRPQADVIQEMYAIEKQHVDSETAQKWRKRVVSDFRRQLMLGVPTAADEEALKILRQQLVQLVTDPQDMVGIDLDIRCLALCSAGRLMDHDLRVRESKPLALRSACQKECSHTGRHSDTGCADVAFYILHGIVDCHAVCHGTARAVDIEVDILVRIF